MGECCNMGLGKISDLNSLKGDQRPRPNVELIELHMSFSASISPPLRFLFWTSKPDCSGNNEFFYCRNFQVARLRVEGLLGS